MDSACCNVGDKPQCFAWQVANHFSRVGQRVDSGDA